MKSILSGLNVIKPIRYFLASDSREFISSDIFVFSCKIDACMSSACCGQLVNFAW